LWHANRQKHLDYHIRINPSPVQFLFEFLPLSESQSKHANAFFPLPAPSVLPVDKYTLPLAQSLYKHRSYPHPNDSIIVLQFHIVFSQKKLLHTSIRKVKTESFPYSISLMQDHIPLDSSLSQDVPHTMLQCYVPIPNIHPVFFHLYEVLLQILVPRSAFLQY